MAWGERRGITCDKLVERVRLEHVSREGPHSNTRKCGSEYNVTGMRHSKSANSVSRGTWGVVSALEGP